VHLSGSALSTAVRASTRVRVILPRALLRDAFDALAAAERAATPTVANDSNEMQFVVKLTVAKYDPVYLFGSTLMDMSSALALNETIRSAILLGVRSGRLWRRTRGLHHQRASGRRPGRAAGPCTSSSIPTGVLSTSQSAFFTHIQKKQVPRKRATTAFPEVLDSWSSSVTQFVMLLNMDHTHWISAAVSLPSGSVTVYESLGRGRCETEDPIVNRFLLFARQAELRWRVSRPDRSVGGIEWTVDQVISTRQEDSYNCVLFAFTYIWCTIYR